MLVGMLVVVMAFGRSCGAGRAVRLQPRQPRVDAVTGLGRHLENVRLRHDTRERVSHRGDIEVEMRDQVCLGQQHEVCLLEHDRVLERLVFTFGHGQRDDVRGLPEIIDRRAYEVAHVLDEEHVAVV